MEEKEVAKQQAKIAFANAVETAKTSILIGDLAKIMRQNGYDIGQNRLFSWLRENGYLMKSGERRNLPTQKSMQLELLEIKEHVINYKNKEPIIARTTKVTGKGQIYFIDKILE